MCNKVDHNWGSKLGVKLGVKSTIDLSYHLWYALPMSRPLRIDSLRIDYQNAWHHVMNRARRGEDLFVDKADYQQFIDLLQVTSRGCRSVQYQGGRLLSDANPLQSVRSICLVQP